ncbi:MAG: molybdopterin-binding protein [Hyphomicrobiales bacterium]|nr:molybdopterin-binding protein [Hyphomicrobiales bacterium]MBV8826411.1 molybdopterin-binding protein [Hyphomicrobiales bacterium]MBV9430031.1 molybdopterin-binding protein [Bradyrhizobiaceae bacterium]
MPQRLPSRLAPLSEVLARIDALAQPVEARELEVAAAPGRVLAANVSVAQSLPAAAIALRDGWAVRSDLVSDAGLYAPVALTPPPKFVEVGAPLPAETDAVLPPDAITMAGVIVEVTASVVAGEGVLAAGADVAPSQILRRPGERLRATDVALLRATGVPRVLVRAPRFVIITANVFIDAIDDTVAPLIARAIAGDGGDAEIVRGAQDGASTLDHALEQIHDADAVVIVGGSGGGTHDASVRTLAQRGTVHVHGVGLVPGETAALGALGGRPVLIIPGRLDAALAAWLVLGRHLIMRLAGRDAPDPGTPVPLARKIASTVGMAEVVLVRACENGVEPIASGYFPLHAMAQADGFVLVAPEREGFPPGATVAMHALP